MVIKECPPGKILNPKTKRCVKIDGKIGKAILIDKKMEANVIPKVEKKDSSKQLSNVLSHDVGNVVMDKMELSASVALYQSQGKNDFLRIIDFSKEIKIPKLFAPFWKSSSLIPKFSFVWKEDSREYLLSLGEVSGLRKERLKHPGIVVCNLIEKNDKVYTSTTLILSNSKFLVEVFVPMGDNYTGTFMHNFEVIQSFFDIIKFDRAKEFLVILKDSKPTIINSEYWTPKEFESKEHVIKIKYDKKDTYFNFNIRGTTCSMGVFIRLANNKIDTMYLTLSGDNQDLSFNLHYDYASHCTVGTIHLPKLINNMVPLWEDIYNACRTKINNLTSQDKNYLFGNIIKSKEEVSKLVLELQRQINLMQYPILIRA